MEIIVEVLVNLYQGFLIIYFFRNFFDGEKNTWADAICSLAGGAFLIAHEFCGWIIPDTIVFLIGFVYMTLTHRGSIIWRIVGCIMLAAAWTISMAIVNLSGSILFNLDIPSIESAVLGSRLLYVVSCNAFLTIVTFFISKVVHQKARVGMTKQASLLFVLLLCSEWLTSELVFVYLSNRMMNHSVMLVLCILLLATIVITLFLYDYLCRTIAHSFEVESNARMIVDARHHQGDLHVLYQTLLKSQHDLKHRLATVEAVIKSGNRHDDHYIHEMLEEVIPASVFLTGNDMVDAILSAKKAIMDKEGLVFQYQAYPLQCLPMDTVTFCILISNLLDNAIQESKKLTHDQKQQQAIDFGFSRSMDMFMITCSNPTVAEKVDISPRRLATMKPYGHGYGIDSIRKTVQEHNGRCSFISGQYRFTVSVILPMEGTT